MKMIACADLGWGIGKDGDLLYNIPEDMKFFRTTTSGKTVIMGRATLESLPGSKPLPKRRNIILSKTIDAVEGAEVCHDEEELLSLLGEEREDAFVIGGESIYRGLLHLCDTAYITRVAECREADRHIPDFDADPEWKIAEETESREFEGVSFKFVTYKRV